MLVSPSTYMAAHRVAAMATMPLSRVLSCHHAHALRSCNSRLLKSCSQTVSRLVRNVQVAAEAAESPPAEEFKKQQVHIWQQRGPMYCRNFCDGDLYQPAYQKFASYLRHHFGNRRNALILDVAAAGGEPALTVAQALPQASIISTDLAPCMVDFGKQRAAVRRASNVVFDVADAENLSQYGDESFDAVTCGFSLFFFPDYMQALREFRRVLKPDGHLALTVWGPVTKMDLLLHVAATMRGLAPDQRVGINPCKFADGAGVLQELGALGFANVGIEDVNCSSTMAVEDAWRLVHELNFEEMITKQQQAGKKDFGVAVRELFMDVAKQKGYLQGDTVCWPNNLAQFIHAQKLRGSCAA